MPPDKLLVIFDGICNFCNWSVDFIIKRDKKRRFVFAPFQDEAARRILATFNLHEAPLRTTFLIEGDRLYEGSTAALRIARRLRFPWPLTWPLIIVPRFLRQWYYNIIARNRYRWWGTRSVCRVPSLEERDMFLTIP